MVHTFVSSCLDYCNCLLYSVSDNLLKKLQAVQNSVALVVTRTSKFVNTTPYYATFIGFLSVSRYCSKLP